MRIDGLHDEPQQVYVINFELQHRCESTQAQSCIKYVSLAIESCIKYVLIAVESCIKYVFYHSRSNEVSDVFD